MRIILITSLLLTSCFTSSNARISNRRYSCVRNLVEIKVPAKEAIGFCSRNFDYDIKE